MKRFRKRLYIVQPSDNLYSIAMKFNTTAEKIASLNHLISPVLFIGQPLMIPIENSELEAEVKQREYKAVTAYTATRPIYVNGVDINTGLYPVLNFKPEGATYPYIYVPIAEFSRVGAKVEWDPNKQVVNVTSDYDELKTRVTSLMKENEYLWSLIETISMKDLGNTPGNLLNWGHVAKEGDWIYYAKAQKSPALYTELYKMRTDLTEDTKLASDDPLFINVLNGWVYYRNGQDNGKIYKIKTDGTQRTKLNDDSSTRIIVANDWIYYANQTEGGKIYKIKTDGTERTKLTDDLSAPSNIIGDWIYYSNASDKYTPYKIKKDGTERTKLNDTSVYTMIVLGDWIFFRNSSDDEKVYRMEMDGSNLIKLSDDPANTMNISGGWVYYTKKDVPGGDLYKIKLDGSNKTFLNVKYVTSIMIFGEWIYYKTIARMVYRVKTDGTDNISLYI